MRKQDLSKMFFRKSKSPFIGKDEWFDNLSEREIKKLFEDIDVPDYNTVEIIGVQILETDSINFKNAHGQIVNKARGIGTDKENVRLLTDSIEHHGWDVRHVPPIVEESDSSLYDGYSRHESVSNVGKKTSPYLVVRRKPCYTIEDVIDEVGLGANNHSQSKRHNILDFKKRFAAYIIRKEQEGVVVTTSDGIKWFDSIPNSFSDSTVKDAVEDVFRTRKAKDTMESFTKKQAEKKGKSLLKLGPKDTVFAFGKRPSKDGRSHYRKRLIADVLEHFAETGEIPKLVGYTEKYSAEDVEVARQELLNEIDNINKMFMQFIGAYKATKGTFELFQFKGFIPQVIDEETDLIN